MTLTYGIVEKSTCERQHESLKTLLIFAQFHHKESTKGCIEGGPASQVTQLHLQIVHTQEREVLTLHEEEES